MTEARKQAKATADAIQAAADRLPPGTRATIRSGWSSASAGYFPVDVTVYTFDAGPASVEFTVTGQSRCGRYITEYAEGYTSLNWSEADCIHLAKAGKELVNGINRLAYEMTVR